MENQPGASYDVQGSHVPNFIFVRFLMHLVQSKILCQEVNFYLAELIEHDKWGFADERTVDFLDSCFLSFSLCTSKLQTNQISWRNSIWARTYHVTTEGQQW